MPTKLCTKCNKIKDIGDFNKNKNKKDGLQTRCKACCKAYNYSSYKDNSESVLAKSKIYYNANSEDISNRKKSNIFLNKNGAKDKRTKLSGSDNSRFSAGRSSAKRRHLSWELTLEQWQIIVAENKCHYCGEGLPKNGCALDRVDSNIGYELNNLVPCCTECNQIKSNNLTYEEMVCVAALLVSLRQKNG